MSFGFSVGDILGGATMAYNLYRSLSATKGSAREYAKLIQELDMVHKVLLQVDQLRGSNHLKQETLNALLFTINTANEAMEDFILRCNAYENSLKAGGSGNIWKDGWKKGKWSIQMPTQIESLRKTLTTMLASVNCLITLACFCNITSARLAPNVMKYNAVSNAELREKTWQRSFDYPGIRLEATIHYNNRRDKGCLAIDVTSQRPYSDFQPRQDFRKFFRCGQVFSIPITCDISVSNGSQTLLDVVQLPEPVGALQEMAKAVRLAQILALPLRHMIRYSEENKNDQNMVRCLLCTHSTPTSKSEHWMSKDCWASEHFRLNHWKYYQHMIMGRGRFCRKIPGSDNKDSYSPPLGIPGESTRDTFSPESWLKLEGITSWHAISTDEEIENVLAGGSQNPWWYCDGPTIIRRFVVIREGPQSCLCLGIHTYAGRGCQDQPDQELFSVIHTSKAAPTLDEKEAKIKLLPIRMSAHHPSTFLPLSARLHFGRIYQITHCIPVRPLGLIDTDYMELLISQFEKVTRQRLDSEDVAVDNETVAEDVAVDNKTVAEDVEVENESIALADMTLVEEIRKNIAKVLGPDVPLTAPKDEVMAPERKKRRV